MYIVTINVFLNEILISNIFTVRIHGELSRPFEIVNGVKQGDALACLLFTGLLEKINRNFGKSTRGTIFNKSVQILAYADDIDITARTESTLKESFLALERVKMLS